MNLQQECQDGYIFVSGNHFDLFDVRAAVRNCRCDFGEHACAIARFALNQAVELPVDLSFPRNGNPFLRLFAEVRQVAASVAVNDDTPAGREVSHDDVAGQWVTAFRVADDHALGAGVRTARLCC